MHAQVRLDSDILMLGPTIEGDRYGMKSPRSLPGQSQCICVALENLDEHYDRAKAFGAEIVTPLHDTPWGARDYTCLDLEGHIWTFGNYWGEPLRHEQK
jgi:uncharacterized glyoxalase superfamily protein PhnB